MRVLSGAALIALVGLSPSAAGADCKSGPEMATGAYANLLFAKQAAREAWMAKVDRQLGQPWSVWRYARNKGYICRARPGHMFQRRCTAKAVPCRSD